MHVGKQLIEQGWRQGSLLGAESAQASWIEHADQGSLRLAAAELQAGDSLIVISHDCDIAAPPNREGRVVALRAYWTTNKTEIHNASRNSIRRFLLRRRTTGDGSEEGLVADATTLLQIDKSVLLSHKPESPFELGDVSTPGRFRQWLAARYNRPAVDNAVDRAVHKPIVDAVRRLKEDDPIYRVLEGVREIRYRLRTDQAPYQVELLLMREEDGAGGSLRDEDVYDLGGWLQKKLEEGGEALLIEWDIRDIWTISVGDYQDTVALDLAHYSSAESAVAGEGAGSAQLKEARDD